MQIRTGEGKSIALGGLSVLLALLGKRVRCVCYSKYLSDRDFKAFRSLFEALAVQDRIVYSMITSYSHLPKFRHVPTQKELSSKTTAFFSTLR